MSALEKDLIDLLLKHNVVDEHSLRDYRIKSKYKELRKEGMSGIKARKNLADQFNIGLKSIEYILYSKKNE